MTASPRHPLLEEKIEGGVVFEGHFLQVHRDRVRLPDGGESVREYVVHPGAVTVLALFDNGNLLLERQFRYPLGRVFLELPAGKIDAGEQPIEAAKRELLEETGHVADDWQSLGVIHNCIGYSNEFIEVYLARDLRHVSDQQLDHNEFLELLEMSPEALACAIRKGEVSDAKTISGLYLLEGFMR